METALQISNSRHLYISPGLSSEAFVPIPVSLFEDTVAVLATGSPVHCPAVQPAPEPDNQPQNVS